MKNEIFAIRDFYLIKSSELGIFDLDGVRNLADLLEKPLTNNSEI
jgi:hypothetical protein